MATGRVPTTANSPLTTKGDLFGYSTAPARLAVGSNGETIVADSSQASGLRYNPQNALANPVINGGMDIWQRGTSVSTTAGYTADRWYANMTVSGRTVSRQTTSDTTNLPNIQYCARVQRDSGGTNTSLVILSQPIETINSIPFAGKVVTMSFYARAGANFSSATSAINASLLSGTGTDQNQQGAGYTGQVSVTANNLTLTTTWQRFTLTGTVGTTATELAMTFFYTPVGTAGAADYFEITGVQIDFGTYTASTAPTFRRSGGTIQGELAACQRYYQLVTGGGEAFGTFYSTTAVSINTRFPVQMRVSPTPTYSTTYTNAIDQIGVSNRTPTAYVTAYVNQNGLCFLATGLSAGGTIGYPAVYISSSSHQLSAEL